MHGRHFSPGGRRAPCVYRARVATLARLVAFLPAPPRGRNARVPSAPRSCASSSTSLRSALEGPHTTLPKAVKREPWHGQSNDFSSGFQFTTHFRCGQTAEQACTLPWSSRYTAFGE